MDAANRTRPGYCMDGVDVGVAEPLVPKHDAVGVSCNVGMLIVGGYGTVQVVQVVS